MSERLGFYRCSVCGNIVQVFHAGFGELVCCNKPMEFLSSNKNDEGASEKHVPSFIMKDDGNILIQVGTELHPMSGEHYIEFIEAVYKDKNEISIKFLHPGQMPVFDVHENPSSAYEYCNIHGLWENRN